MSKAIVGAVEIGAAFAATAWVGGIGGLAALSAQGGLLSAYSSITVGLAASGIATEAGALAQALGSKSGIGVTTRTPASLRQIIRGEQRVGGNIVYVSTTGSTHRQYNMVIVLATHPCEAILNLYLDGRQVYWQTGSDYNQHGFGGDADSANHTGPNGVQYNFGGKVFCAAFLGKQNSDPTVVGGVWVGPDNPAGFCSALQANDPTWSPTTQGTPYLPGCTYVYLKLEADAGTFPQFPEIRFTVQGKNDIWDPRLSERKYTTNWALHVADAITDPTWGLGDDSVNQDQLIAAANVCDESVTCAAGSEARYSLHWHYDTGTPPGEAIEHMMSAAQGRLSRIGGEWYIWPAYWQGPSFTFDENSLLDAVQWTSRRSLGELVNRVTGTYIAPNYPYNVAGNLYDSNGFWNGETANNFPYCFQPTNFPQYACDPLHGYSEDVYLIADTPNLGAYSSGTAYASGAVVIYNGAPWKSNEAVPAGNAPGTNDGSGNPYWSPTGNYLSLELTLDTVLSVSQAQRLAKIAMLRNRQQGQGTLVMSLAAFQMQPLDVMQFNFPAMGWSDKLLEVAGAPNQRMRLRYGTAPKASGGEGDEQEQAPALFVEVPVSECDPSVYEWDPSEELTPYDVPAITGGASVWTVGAPSSVVAESDLSTALVQPNGTVIPQIELSWTEPSDTFVTNGGSIEIQICAHSSAAWQDVSLVGGQTTKVYLGGVVAGQSYDLRLRSVRSSGATSDWVEIDNVVCGNALSFTNAAVAPAGTLVGQALSGGTAQISILSFTATLGSATASCTPSPATLTGLNQAELYYVYYHDANFLGGTITPIATQNQADFLNKPGYYLIGSLVTPSYTPRYQPTTYSDTGTLTTSSPSAAYDNDVATSAGMQYSASNTGDPDTSYSYGADCIWSGFPNKVLSADTTLHVIASANDGGGLGMTSYLYVHVGSSTTTLVTYTGTSAEADHTVTIPAGTNLATISVEASASAAGVGTGQSTYGAVAVFEVYIQ